MNINYLREVRGRGLFIAMEPYEDSGITGEMLSYECLKQGMIATRGQGCLRLLPPLIFTKSNCDEALEKLENAFRNVNRNKKYC